MPWTLNIDGRPESQALDASSAFRDRSRQNRNRALLLAIIVAALVLVDQLTGEPGAVLPMDLRDPEQTLAEWKRAGFLIHINAERHCVTVREDEWRRLTDDERASVSAFLVSCVASDEAEAGMQPTILGAPSGHVLFGGSAGLSVTSSTDQAE